MEGVEEVVPSEAAVMAVGSAASKATAAAMAGQAGWAVAREGCGNAQSRC